MAIYSAVLLTIPYSAHLLAAHALISWHSEAATAQVAVSAEALQATIVLSER